MRQGQQNNKRMRNRNRKGPNPLTRSYESNGGDVKIRGTALHVAEKYVQLARDAQASGDRVAGENYLQHAEHYFRIVAAAQAQMPQPQQPMFRNDDGEGDEEDEFGNAQGGFGGNNNYGGNAYGGGGQNYGGGNYSGGNNNGGNNGYQGNQGNRNGGQQPNHQGGQQHYNNPADQLPAFINGGNGGGSGGGNTIANSAPQEQPQFEGAPQGQGEYRQPANNGERGGQERGGQNPGGGNFRRRRRPFREQYSGGDRNQQATGGERGDAGGDDTGE
jgi:hypothetical protein